MERPDMKETLEQAQRAMAIIEDILAKAQDHVTRTRFSVTMATEMAASRNEVSFDHIVKAQIFSESMHDTFTRIIEARTHLDVATRALGTPEQEPPRVTL